MRTLLVMRKGFDWHADHISTLRHLGFEVHLLTEVPGADVDGRFASVTLVPPGQDLDLTTQQATELARKRDIGMALTFIETDIVLASLINQRLGLPWARPEADMIARDKWKQRKFLAANSIPSVRFAPVSSVDEATAEAERIGYPIIIKPTHAAFSRGVALVHTPADLEREMRVIQAIALSKSGNYFVGREEKFALLEEFLPGIEVTLDGVVIGGRFHLAGVINKMYMPGPYFEENYYSLPFKTPERESEVIEIAEGITQGLGVRHCLFNVELRQDNGGRFRVVEFSTRMSGGQNYYNLREAHGIDVVRLYAKALHSDDYDTAWSGEVPRIQPRRSTCTAYAYRTGLILRNFTGAAANSPFFREYIPIARPGDRLARAPKAYDVAGAFSVASEYEGPDDVSRIERIAADLDEQLDILVVPDETDAPLSEHLTSREKPLARGHGKQQ
jgi:biotin carboxylase